MHTTGWGKTPDTQHLPFDKQGNQMHYPNPYWAEGMHWRTNGVFADTLTYVGYQRGRSAAYFEFARTNGAKVCVFMADMDNIIPHMRAGYITGTFTFCKRGANYGCRLVEV